MNGRSTFLALGLLVGLVAVATVASAAQYTAVTSGDWDDPATWGGEIPVIEDPSDVVTIPEGITVTIDVFDIVTADNGVEFDGPNATIVNQGELSVHGELHLEHVTVENSGTFEVRATVDYQGVLTTGWLCEIVNTGEFIVTGAVDMFASKFTNGGSVTVSSFWGFFKVHVRTSFVNGASATFVNDATLVLTSILDLSPNSARFSNLGTLTNNGYLLMTIGEGAGTASLFNDGQVTNSTSGVMEIGGSISNFAQDDATTRFDNFGSITLLRNGRFQNRTRDSDSGRSIIDNRGTIDATDGRFGQDGGGGEHDIIYNRTGSTMIGGFTPIHAGRFVNESGATFILADGERLENEASIENGGSVNNLGDIVNAGSFYQLCDGSYQQGPDATFVGYARIEVCDPTPPEITPWAIGTLGNNGWYTSAVEIGWDVTDDESPVVSTWRCDSAIVSGDTTGISFTCEAASLGGDSVATLDIKRDATAPTASASASPAPNPSGWNNTEVTVTFGGVDATSGIDSCDAPIILSADGAGQSASGQCTDLAGNTSVPATAAGIDIDRTPPTVSATAAPIANVHGWNNTDVTVTYAAVDGLSGVASCDTPHVLDSEGTEQLPSGSCTDNAGNTASAVPVTGVNIDKTDPVITFNGNLGSYTLTDLVSISCVAIDALSGIDSQVCPEAHGPAFSFDLLAPNVLSATASDLAGNSTSATTEFTIQVTQDGAELVVEEFVDKANTVESMKRKLDKIVTATAEQKPSRLAAFEDYVTSKIGLDGLTHEEADILLAIAAQL